MNVMPLHFRTLRYFGLWYGADGQHWLVKYIWRQFVICIISLFALLLLADLKAYRDNMRDLTECIFMSLTTGAVCLKLLNFMIRRDALDLLLSEFRTEICQPRNLEEIDVTAKYEKMISLIFYSFMVLAQLTGLAFLSLPLFSIVRGRDDIDFPVKIYKICSKENVVCYALVYVFQLLSVTISIALNVKLDTMLASSILLTCAQIDLYCYRFGSSSNDDIQKSTKECVIHQMLIRKIVRKLELFFISMALPLVLFGLITLCTSTYSKSKMKIGDAESFLFFMCLWFTLIQLLCYCWFGNELRLKSTKICETIYHSDWTISKPSDRKILYFVMLSTQRETGISFQGFFTISLQMFVWVLKTSYAAYNLLKSVEARK